MTALAAPKLSVRLGCGLHTARVTSGQFVNYTLASGAAQSRDEIVQRAVSAITSLDEGAPALPNFPCNICDSTLVLDRSNQEARAFLVQIVGATAQAEGVASQRLDAGDRVLRALAKELLKRPLGVDLDSFVSRYLSTFTEGGMRTDEALVAIHQLWCETALAIR